ncbi:MAG: hypothetical protein MUE60_13830, partial [Candidatus Eisenbacteria bacterium]|nr:hypothetical protein [Candidatus Eisenbacteria bacterium]
RVIEPYLHPDDTPLDFELDLSGPGAGRHCEERTHYPWDQPIFGPDVYPSGQLTSFSGCKGWNAAPDDSFAPTQDCLAVSYRSDHFLELRHINAGFNCCPGEIAASVEISGNLISIVESEAEQGCRCDCLFDLDYRIQDLSPGVYRIHVAEPYARPEWGDAPLDFVFDLTAPVSDTLCAERTHHPWGLW